MTVVNESGLYEVVIRSDSQKAKPFRYWITHDVLPQIRKTGVYGAVKELSGPELIAKALIEANEVLSRTRAELETARPKAESFNAFLGASGDWSVNDAAKMLNRAGVTVGAKRLTEWMLVHGWLYRAQDHALVPYQPRIDAGHLTTKAQRHYHPYTGELIADRPQVRVTPKGLDLLSKHLTKEDHDEVV